LAPFFSVFFALVAFAAIPFGDRIVLGGRVIELQVAKIDVALLYVFAMLSLDVYGVILAGFASRNNYALLGGLRATAQMISYEIALGIAIIGVVMVYGTMDLQELVRGQGKTLGGWIPFWGIIAQPVAFFVFLTAALAETKRIPFDLPEGESEIIAGYYIEYSGFKFALFFLGEYLGMFAVSGLAITLFLGGWTAPFLFLTWIPSYVWFFTKLLALIFMFIWLRGTLPRLRMDQLMNFAWKFMLPMALLNIVVAGLWHFTGREGWSLLVRWLVCAAILAVPYFLLGRAFDAKAGKRVYRYAN
jgi:NADH-quinone oxidoreductase subunit H